jgi:23S rRNA (uracil-5-)-methyltransferase RumA
MVIFVTKSGINYNIEKLAESMVGGVPEIKSFWWVENDQISDVVNYQQKHLIYGNQFIEETLFDYRFRIYPETFFQPNTKGAEKLYGVIVSMAQEVHPESVLGLFCGSGPIEILLSRISHNVTGVDNNPSNIVVAKENCDINNITNCVFHCVSAEQFLKNVRDKQHKYDLLVVDPPRGGLTNKAMFHLLRVKIPKIIYVSCNVSTLARDLSILMDNGYQLKKFTAIDMFPHTGHIESCCLLEMK